MLAACGGGTNDAAPTTVDATQTDAEPVPELGAANALTLSAFDALQQRAIDEYPGVSTPAALTPELVGKALSVLLDGPLMPELQPATARTRTVATGLDALELLPPFQPGHRRASWPHIHQQDDSPVRCEHGTVVATLVDEVPADARPYLHLGFDVCQIRDLEVTGSVLIERPRNALERPTRIAYDNLLVSDTTTSTRLIGTFTWSGGDDCGIGERRIAHLLTTDITTGRWTFLDGLTSYATAPSIVRDCGDAVLANAWDGSIDFGAYGRIDVATSDALTHDWEALPRATDDDVIFGTNVEPRGLVTLHGETDATDGRITTARLALMDISTLIADSGEDIAFEMRISTDDDVTLHYRVSTRDAAYGALSKLADTDNDGMPDGWERIHGLNPDSPDDADIDPDGDGYSNVEEFTTVRDPSDPAR